MFCTFILSNCKYVQLDPTHIGSAFLKNQCCQDVNINYMAQSNRPPAEQRLSLALELVAADGTLQRHSTKQLLMQKHYLTLLLYTHLPPII